jgi:UDP-N-acetylmuramate--alanine ligase
MNPSTTQPGSELDLVELELGDLSEPRRVHIVGVGGAGMSAIASVLAAMGHTVSGSDLKDSPGLERLAARGVTVTVGHDAANLGSPDLVAVSTAIPERNTEVAAARQRGIPVLRRAKVLASICATRRTLAVAGTHGKTTTSSMLALILVEAGLRPSFIIGGDVNEIGTGAVWDEGELFVVEADESDGTFLELPGWGGVVTNVEADHLDYYGTVEAMRDAFARFLRALPGPRVVGVDLPWGAELAGSLRAEGHRVVTAGRSPEADYQIAALHLSRAGAHFDLVRYGERLGRIELPVSGAHNAINAACATALAMEAGASFAACQAALARFAGVARRLQFRGEARGVTFIDDYAHLPTEVAAATEATATGGWGRVVVVFQPHRYSRIGALWADFAHAFAAADKVVLTDVYAAGEQPVPGISGKLIVDAVLEAHPFLPVAYLPRRADLVTYLSTVLRPGDVCLTLGAGDLTSLPDEMLARLDAAAPTPVAVP